MTRRTRRTLIYILSTLIVCALLLEGVFRFIDPIGIYRYFADYNALTALSLPAPDGLRYTPGIHRFSMYTAIIGGDGFRTVQGGNGGDCIIAFVGDSVTFGMGSDISFVDYLAPDLPATVINAGIPGYSAANVAREIDLNPADGYVWLIIGNDDNPFFEWQRPTGNGLPSALSFYIGYYTGSFELAPVNEARFREHAAPVIARDDVLAFALEGAQLTDIAHELGAVVIPNYTHTVSLRDAHPSPEGAAEIADAMRDNVVTFEAQQCAGTV